MIGLTGLSTGSNRSIELTLHELSCNSPPLFVSQHTERVDTYLHVGCVRYRMHKQREKKLNELHHHRLCASGGGAVCMKEAITVAPGGH
jgi:hypothetical protein